MIELVDTFPDVSVEPAEYQRLLGYPRDRVIEGRARELADETRAWYTKSGRPWVYAREAKSVEIGERVFRIDGVPFSCERLQGTLRQADAHSVALVAVGAGPEVEEEARKLWREEKPDEYFFLEVYGSAVVEHLVTMTGARLCAWAEGLGMAVLPHYSPGYPEWDIIEQPRLLDLMRYGLPGRVEVLDSGMLRPKKTLLAVFGLTRRIENVRRLSELVPCENCSYQRCQFRRAPHRAGPETQGQTSPPQGAASTPRGRSGLSLGFAAYTVNTKALKQWAEKRLSLAVREDGTIEALFRFDGTTCTNTGRPLAFHYRVKLGPREGGYPILEQRCGPAPGDTGHTFMCEYLKDGAALMRAIDCDRPLLGRPLGEVLSWQRRPCTAGCYCERESREHHWGLVLETIHYALRP